MRHPVLDHRLEANRATEYERSVAAVMALTEESLLNLVPPYGAVLYCECPACYAGIQQEQRFLWDIDHPSEIKCKHCGATFPDARFPETGALQGLNGLGESVSLPYYFNPERAVSHFLSTHCRHYQKVWLTQQCLALGIAYRVSGNEAYAQRAILVLEGFARVYPHWPTLRNNPVKVEIPESQKPPYPWDGGRWAGFFAFEIPDGLIRAYDLVYDSRAWDGLKSPGGEDARTRIENDLFLPALDAIRCRSDLVSNTPVYLGHAATLGRVIGRPDLVHWALHWMRENICGAFFYDGVYPHSLSYHAYTLINMRLNFDAVRGYSDPPGYCDPVDGTRFDHLVPETVIPFWDVVQTAPQTMIFPDGRLVPFHDCPGDPAKGPLREASRSRLYPGIGHAILGHGKGPNQCQAHLHFSGEYGHAHFDSLNLILWARGRELISDVGYTWTNMRQWARSAVCHNTVVIDRSDQVKRPLVGDGDLLAFFPDCNGVSAVEADGRRAYSNLADIDVYRRLLVLIPVSDQDAYVVDVFRARGGHTHDWMLHGDADYDMRASCSLPLPGRRENLLESGESFRDPDTEYAVTAWYGMIRDVRSGPCEAPDGCRVDLTYADDPDRGVRVHLLPPPGTQVFMGRSPSVRRAGTLFNADNRHVYDFWMPHVCLRRQSRDAALQESLFAAVHEPFQKAGCIQGVERVALTPGAGNAIALRVVHGTSEDTIISTTDAPPYPERRTANGCRIKGRLGVIRKTAGRVTGLWLFDGESLAAGDCLVTGRSAPWTGRLIASCRRAEGAAQDAFECDIALPADGSLNGRWLIVTHGNGFRHGYPIERVERLNGRTTIVLACDHGLAIAGDQTRELFFPRRTIEGINTFTIPLFAGRFENQG